MFEPAPRPIWWLPTFGFFLFLSVEAGMFFSSNARFEDPAVGRHLRAAEVILETGKVPRTDPLSFTHAGEPWMDFEWAFEATLGELYRVGGLGLVSAFCFTIFGVTLLGIYRTLLQSGFSIGAVVVGVGMAFLTLHMHFEARPVLFTYLFMALVVEVWNRRTEPLPRDWIFLPIVFVAWANLHAGWAAALIFLSLALAGRLVDRLTHRVTGDDAPLIPWIGLTLLCAYATSFNPWGWKMHRHIYEMATSYKSFALWDEYAPPNFRAMSMSAIAVFFIIVIFLGARLNRRTKAWRVEALLPVLFFLYEGLKAQRHVILLIEVALVPIIRDLDSFLGGTWWPYVRGRFQEFQETQRLAQGDAWLAMVAAVVISLVFVHSVPAHNIPVGRSVTPRLIEFIQQHPDRLQRPLVTTWNGGPLLWNARPDFRVSFDDRGDFYGDAVVFAYVDLCNGVGGWRDTLEHERFDSAILDPYMHLNQLLRLEPGWSEVYRDEHAVVYWKASPGP